MKREFLLLKIYLISRCFFFHFSRCLLRHYSFFLIIYSVSLFKVTSFGTFFSSVLFEFKNLVNNIMTQFSWSQFYLDLYFKIRHSCPRKCLHCYQYYPDLKITSINLAGKFLPVTQPTN